MGNISLGFTLFPGAKEHYAYINGTLVSDFSVSSPARLPDIKDGDVVTIKAYSDFDKKKLIAEGTITYNE